MDPQRVLPHGGTRPRPTEELRSPLLRAQGAAVAAFSLRQIDEAWPDLAVRYGERGRQLTAEDNLWHLNFLDAAVALGDDAHFERYADWLVRFLGPRGLNAHHVAGAFGFLAEGLARADCPAELEEHRRALIRLLRRAGEWVLGQGADGVVAQEPPGPAPPP
jgi:hypothetical protein